MINFCPNQRGLAPLILLFVIVAALGVSAIAGGAYFGIKQSQNFMPLPIASVTVTPSIVAKATSTPSVMPFVSPSPSPKQSAAATPTANVLPVNTPSPITIPSNWKKYTVDDNDFKIKTTMSLPPEFEFLGSYGWTFMITGSDLGISESWEHKTSYTRAGDDVEARNHYNGGSRRAWYQKNRLDYEGGRITAVEELPVGDGSTYLKLSVNYPNQSGEFKNQAHFLYVENGILHYLIPLAADAYSAKARIPSILDKIFYSLKSVTY